MIPCLTIKVKPSTAPRVFPFKEWPSERSFAFSTSFFTCLIKPFAVVVSEGAKPKDGEMVIQNVRDNGAGVDNTKLGGVGQVVAKQLEEITGLEARNTTLGYMQRGGTPTAFDRVLSTKYGSKAMELALEGKFGTLTVIKNGKLDSVSLEDVVGNNTKIGAVSGNTVESNLRKVTMEDDLVKTARNIGINLGD